MATEKLQVSPEDAPMVLSWLQSRGGVLKWFSVDMSDPGWSVITPARDAEGVEVQKPHWKAGPSPRLITDPNEVEVQDWQEYKRFHVAVRVGDSGVRLKLTDGASRRLERALAKAKEHCQDARYAFDYSSQEAVVYVPKGRAVPLAQWAEQNKEPAT